MKTRILFMLIFCAVTQSILNAQDLKLFTLRSYHKSNNQKSPFISLSDIYPLSDHPDSLALPVLTNEGAENKEKFEYFKLNLKYRKRFLADTKIAESDIIYIYDYSSDVLISFSVKNTAAVACLNVYGADWPYAQQDYMIGFEIEKKFLTGLDLSNTLVYIGKENPFYQGQIKNIRWKKIEQKDFPDTPINAKLHEDLKKYYNFQESKFSKGDVLKFETDGMQYFIQDLKPIEQSFPMVRRLIVISTNTKETMFEDFTIESESISPAPLHNQWTGKLIKNKPPVIFGLEYNSFGCPGILYLSQTEKPIPIECDNRH